MHLKTIFLTILIIALLCCMILAEDHVNPERKKRSAGFLLDLFFQSPKVCNGCPSHYCDTDPGIILGYCCGCRRVFDILPVFCPSNLFCPSVIRDVCHDYEYMLNCCC